MDRRFEAGSGQNFASHDQLALQIGGLIGLPLDDLDRGYSLRTWFSRQ